MTVFIYRETQFRKADGSLASTLQTFYRESLLKLGIILIRSRRETGKEVGRPLKHLYSDQQGVDEESRSERIF